MKMCVVCVQREEARCQKRLLAFKAWWEIGALANVNGFEAEC